MTREELIRMAREVGLWLCVTDMFPEELERFAALIAAAEREACAEVCDEMELQYWRSAEDQSNFTPVDCADAIRARGTNETK